MIATISVVIISIVVAFWFYSTFNTIVASNNAVDQTWSNVEVELQRRYNLIPNLVEVVRGYASHEAETLESVIASRGAAGFSDAGHANQALPAMNSSLTRLFAVVENYPDIKADKQFLELQGELSNTENRIAERRQAYNQTVNIFENLRLKVPSNIVASTTGFKEREYFDAPDDVKEAVQVELL